MQQAAPSAPEALRVLHVIPTLTGGGAEKFLCALATAFDPRVVHAGIMPVYRTRVPFDEPALHDVEVLQIDRSGRYDPGFLRRMLRGIRAFRPDIVHAHLHNGKYWGRLTALAAHVPIVVFTEHSPKGEKRIAPEILVDRVLNRITQGVITFTGRQRTMLQNAEHIPAVKIHVIENGIPLPPAPDLRRRVQARARMKLADDEFAVLVLGRLEPVKNTQLAVRALRCVRPEVRERLRLLIVGDGSQMPALRALADTLHVAEHVAFLGHRSDAVDLLYGADALLLPSLVEGMPLAALEAMSVALPIVTTPWPGAAELLADGRFGTVTADWTPQQVARAVEWAALHREAWYAKGRRAMHAARLRYDIRRAAREHEALYLRLARANGLR